MWYLYLITLKQMLRHSTLWYIILFSLVSSEIAPAFAELFTFGRVEVAVIDASQACVYLGVLLATVNGCYSLMGKELNEKVALTLFTKPITLSSFVWAKYASLISGLLVLVTVQGVWLYKQSIVLEWTSLGLSNALFALGSVFFQGIILLSVAILFTIRFGGLVGVIITLLFCCLSYIFPQNILPWICPLLPALPWYDLSPVIYSAKPVSGLYFILISLYAIVYSTASLFFATKILERRDF